MADQSDLRQTRPTAVDDDQGLGEVGHRRQVSVAGVRISGRRRRPTGEKPPLQRELRRSGWFWLILGLGLMALWISLFAFPPTTGWWATVDHAVLNWFMDVRSDAATTVMKWLQFLGSLWVIRPIRWATLIVLAVFKRWRAFVGVLLAFIIVPGPWSRSSENGRATHIRPSPSHSWQSRWSWPDSPSSRGASGEPGGS